MWRFFNNIPRALRQHFHGPRAVGVHVEESEPESIPNQELSSLEKCEIKENSQLEQSSFIFSKKDGNEILSEAEITEEGKYNRYLSKRKGILRKYKGQWERTKQEKDKRWWRACRYDLCALLHRNHLFEVLTVGSTYIWGSESNKLPNRKRLIYRVLFSLSSGDNKLQISGDDKPIDTSLPSNDSSKDEIKQNDAKVQTNSSLNNDTTDEPPETIESALREFQKLCQDYSSKNESLLALQAVDDGKMSAAFHHFKSACAMGNVSACFNSGLCYEIGFGVVKDINEAIKYYESAARHGHIQAKYNLGLIYLDEDETYDDSLQKRGFKYIQDAADGGLVEAQTQMGILYMEQDDLCAATKYFQAAADQNDCEAQYFLAMCHEQGWGVDLNMERALQLYSAAAKDGHEGAIYNLGVYHELGLGEMAVNIETAVNLYQKAAEAGNTKAQCRLIELEAEQVGKRHQEEIKRWKLNGSTDSLITPPSSPMKANLSPSSSSPNLISHKDVNPFVFPVTSHSLGELHQLSTTLTLNDQDLSRRKSGQFYIGEDDDKNDDMWGLKSLGLSLGMNSVEKGNMVYPELTYSMYGHFHKSHTSPNLTAVVACNI